MPQYKQQKKQTFFQFFDEDETDHEMRRTQSQIVFLILETNLCFLPILWCVGQWDNDVLVDEDEEGQEEAKAHGTDNVHDRQPLKRSHVEDGPVMNFKDWNWAKKMKNYN